MKNFFKNNLLTITGIIFGAIAGYFYWQLIGCTTGSCAITSKPINSTVYGALMGGLMFNVFQKNKIKTIKSS